MFKHVFTALKRWLGPRKIEHSSPAKMVNVPLLARSIKAARKHTHRIGPGRRSIWTSSFARRTSKYMPHQSSREKARRMRQSCARENMRLIVAELAGGQFGAGA